MIWVAIGPSGCGKSYAVQHYYLPQLLKAPRKLCELAPARFGVVLVQDPPTSERPRGQYIGLRYTDVSDWLRRPQKSRVSCFSAASVDSLCKLALRKEVPQPLLVLDEIDECLPSGVGISEEAVRLCNRGRHFGAGLIGTARRLNSINREVRGNIQFLLINNLADKDDRRDAAKMMGLASNALDGVTLPRGHFIEWQRSTGAITHVEFRDGKRVAIGGGLAKV